MLDEKLMSGKKGLVMGVANDRSISPIVTTKTRGMTRKIIIGRVVITAWWNFGAKNTSGADAKKIVIIKAK